MSDASPAVDAAGAKGATAAPGSHAGSAAPRHKPAHVTKLYVGMVLIQGCASALGMYGLIVALLLSINISTECNPDFSAIA